MKTLKAALVTFLVLCSATAANAQMSAAPNPGEALADSRIKKILDELGYKYTVTPTGNFRLTFGTTGKRTQAMVINSKTEKYKGFEIREFWSIGYKCSGEMPSTVGYRLLSASEMSKLGFWTASKSGNDTFATYNVRLSADSNKSSVDDVIHNVIASSDKMELELTNKDEF